MTCRARRAVAVRRGMGGFDRGLARLLLETCRYTSGAAFQDAANQTEAREALAWSVAD